MLTTTIDVPKEQEQALTVQTTVKAKDHKKQEAGRKGAMARRQKLEALLAQSQAAKKKKMDSEPKTTVARTASQVYAQGSEGPGWGVGIGVAVGVALFALSRTIAMKRAAGTATMKRVPSSEGGKPLVQFTADSRPMFDME